MSSRACAAAAGRRPRLDLFHSALAVTTTAGDYMIELAPVPAAPGRLRGVAAEGAVGARWAGRSRWFRYEVRCWPGGTIADRSEAVQSPLTISTDASMADQIVRLVRQVPLLVWGRDESRTGEMWNSNSVTSWLLERAGVNTSDITLPEAGRAPGWHAGTWSRAARWRAPQED